MSIEHPDEVAKIMSALDSETRVRTFHLLHQGMSPKDIAEQELDYTRSGIQPYLNSFKEAGLVEVEGKKYRFTEKGEKVHELLTEFDKLHKDLNELQEFLVENPDVVPDEVLEEIERRRREQESE
ncbi:winged helix-turn-helix domain-containing protein [Halogeometricum sp. CBA1124]|uniref:winged helix-turn-helix domain-containing protein n=1 Tax=Halogeometricum sp. CBA1124 TaxID=2668071 RepID=UPI0018D21C06|nr:winged helix-turn-helix domain-containing protein [Halogeometricum sp. CBA1124]